MMGCFILVPRYFLPAQFQYLFSYCPTTEINSLSTLLQHISTININNTMIITITDLLANKTLFLSDIYIYIYIYIYIKQFMLIRQTFTVNYICTLLKSPLPALIKH